MTEMIGYPDYILNDTALTQEYAEVSRHYIIYMVAVCQNPPQVALVSRNLTTKNNNTLYKNDWIGDSEALGHHVYCVIMTSVNILYN